MEENKKIVSGGDVLIKCLLEEVPAIFEKLSKPEHDELKVIVELD